MDVAAVTQRFPARNNVLKVRLRNDGHCEIGLGVLGLPESARCGKWIVMFEEDSKV